MSPLIISTPVGYMMIFALSPCLAKMPRSMPTKPGAWSLAVPAPILRSMGAWAHPGPASRPVASATTPIIRIRTYRASRILPVPGVEPVLFRPELSQTWWLSGWTWRAHAPRRSLSSRRARIRRRTASGSQSASNRLQHALPDRRVGPARPEVVLLRRIGLQIEELRVVAVVVVELPPPRAEHAGLDGHAASPGGALVGAVLRDSLVQPGCRRRSAPRRGSSVPGRPAGAGASRASSIVAVRSIRFTTWPRRSPAGRRPGQARISGTFTDSSKNVCFHQRPRSPSWSPWSVE